MIDELNLAIEAYHAKWHKLVGSCKDETFFRSLKPTAVGWKVTDRAEYDRLLAEMHDECDSIIEKWMNGRWIAKLVLRDKKLEGDIKIIKLMQRRPGSSDAVGLDHLDFYTPDIKAAEQVLQNEDLKWTWESNDVIAGYDWISVWFDGTEAKFKSDTVLDIIIAELQETNQGIVGKTV